MGKAVRLAAILCGALLVAATWRGDVAADVDAEGSAPVPSAEPTTSVPVQPAPGSESAPLEPFQPHSAGPPPWDNAPKPLWSYTDLTPAEQAAADRGRDIKGWPEIHNAFQAAARERAERAAAESAQRQLGAEHLGSIGVVP